MNKERLEIIAEWLEAGAPHKNGVTGFNMAFGASKTEPACGTACCIAGAAVYFFAPEEAKRFELDLEEQLKDKFFHPEYDVASADFFGYNNIEEIACKLLDLDYDTGDELFVPSGIVALSNIQPSEAAAVIRELIKTGEVNWEDHLA